MKKIVLVGGGHSHLELIKKTRGKNIHFTLISNHDYSIYSGMFPGYIAGHYRLREICINLRKLSRKYGFGFIKAEIIKIDSYGNKITDKNGIEYCYDILSLNTGSIQNIKHDISMDNVVSIKPWQGFMKNWFTFQKNVMDNLSKTYAIFVVGGGASGIEMALSIKFKLKNQKNIKICVLTKKEMILSELSGKLQNFFKNLLKKNQIELITSFNYLSQPNLSSIFFPNHTIHEEFVAIATGVQAPTWIEHNKLKTDSNGFLLVNDYLQCVDYKNIFASGDLASFVKSTTPKSGVYAVRQGKTLSKNLFNITKAKKLLKSNKKKYPLSIISTGEKYAVAIKGSFFLKGKLIWSLKKTIDKKFVKGF